MNTHQSIKRQAQGTITDGGYGNAFRNITKDLARLRKDPRHSLKGGGRKLSLGRKTKL